MFSGYAARGTEASPLALVGGDVMMTVDGRGWTGSTFSVGSASMQYLADGNWSGTSNPTRIVLRTTASASTSPADRLTVGSDGAVKVNGQLATGSQTITSGATNTIDWNTGNAISTNYSCVSPLIMDNLRDGGTYSLVVTSTGTGQCSFSASTTGADAATVTYRFKPANAARTASSHSIYTLTRIGTVVYVSWTSGF